MVPLISGPFNPASGAFLAAPSLINNNLNWELRKVMEAGVLSTGNGGGEDGQTKRSPCPGAPQGPIQFHDQRSLYQSRI